MTLRLKRKIINFHFHSSGSWQTAPVRSHENIAVAANKSLADRIVSSVYNDECLRMLYILFPAERPPHGAERHTPRLCFKKTRVDKRSNVLYAVSRYCLITTEREVVHFECDGSCIQANVLVFIERHVWRQLLRGVRPSVSDAKAVSMGAPTVVSIGISSIQLSDATSSITESSIGGGVATAAQEFETRSLQAQQHCESQVAAERDRIY